MDKTNVSLEEFKEELCCLLLKHNYEEWEISFIIKENKENIELAWKNGYKLSIVLAMIGRM